MEASKSILELADVLLEERSKNIDLERKLNAAALRELKANETIRALQRQLDEKQAATPEPPKQAVKPAATADARSPATAPDAARLADLRAWSVANILRATWSKQGRTKLYALIEKCCLDSSKAFYRYNATQFIFNVLEPNTYAAGCREKILDELDFSDFVWATKRPGKRPSTVADPVDLALQLEADNQLAQKRADIRLAILRQSLTKCDRAKLHAQVQELVRSSFPMICHSLPPYDALFLHHAPSETFFRHCQTELLDKLTFE